MSTDYSLSLLSGQDHAAAIHTATAWYWVSCHLVTMWRTGEKVGTVVHAYIPATREAEGEGSLGRCLSNTARTHLQKYKKKEKTMYTIKCKYGIILCEGLKSIYGPFNFRHRRCWDQTPTGTTEGFTQSSLCHRQVKSINAWNEKAVAGGWGPQKGTFRTSCLSCLHWLRQGQCWCQLFSAQVERACHPSAEQLPIDASESEAQLFPRISMGKVLLTAIWHHFRKLDSSLNVLF